MLICCLNWLHKQQGLHKLLSIWVCLWSQTLRCMNYCKQLDVCHHRQTQTTLHLPDTTRSCCMSWHWRRSIAGNGNQACRLLFNHNFVGLACTGNQSLHWRRCVKAVGTSALRTGTIAAAAGCCCCWFAWSTAVMIITPRGHYVGDPLPPHRTT